MLELIIITILIAADQAAKYLTDAFLMPLGSTIPVWPGVFQLTSTHNTGAAWGLLSGFRWFFIVLTIAVCFFLALYLIRYRKKMHWLPRVTLALILAGAVGNLIDRAALGYVRDMFYFVLIDFPVFNVADSALSVGCVLLAINVLFMKDHSILASFDEKPPREGEERAG